MKELYKLRKKVAEKSSEAEMWKNKYTKVLQENIKLKDELVELGKSKTFGVPFTKETKHALFCAEHEKVDSSTPHQFSEDGVVGSATNFSELNQPAKDIFAKICEDMGVDPNLFTFRSPSIDPYKEEIDRKWLHFMDDMISPAEWAKKNVHPNIAGYKTFDDTQAEIDSEVAKEDMVESDVAFFSRFMPNVKFDAVKFKTDFADILIEKEQSAMLGCAFFKTDSKGGLTACPNLVTYSYWEEKEVSIYEAIPELVPEGMVYDKVKDELVQKVCVNQMCGMDACDCDDSHSFTDDIDSIEISDEEMEGFAEKIGDSITKEIVDDFTRQIGDITNIAFSKLDKLLKK